MEDKTNGSVESNATSGVQNETEQTTEKQEQKTEVNPIEELKKIAQEKGLDPDDLEITTKKELQSKIDSMIAKALKTREENLKKQQVIEEMKKKGEYEKLLKEERRVALQDLKTSFVQANGLDAKLADIIQVDNLIDLDLTQAKARLQQQVQTVVDIVNQLVEQKLNERIKSMETGSFKTTKATSASGMLPQTREELLRLPYQKQVEIYQSHPDLYNNLMNSG